MQLGRKIRDLRLRQGLTVQQLGEATGLSKGFVSQVENSRTSPSLSTLQDLARALKTSVAYLVAEDDQQPHVVRALERPRIQKHGAVSWVEVLSAQPRRALELIMLDLPAGERAGDHRHHHHGEEVLLCAEGSVRLYCGEHVLELEAGDSCHYDGRVPHAIENAGGVPARALLATAPSMHEAAVARPGATTHMLDSEVAFDAAP